LGSSHFFGDLFSWVRLSLLLSHISGPEAEWSFSLFGVFE
jgi:hypothetical protein